MGRPRQRAVAVFQHQSAASFGICALTDFLFGPRQGTRIGGTESRDLASAAATVFESSGKVAPQSQERSQIAGEQIAHEAATRRHTTGHPYRTPFWRPIRTTGSPGRYVIQAQLLRRSFATLIAASQRLTPDDRTQDCIDSDADGLV
jgi:hypothetical protein